MGQGKKYNYNYLSILNSITLKILRKQIGIESTSFKCLGYMYKCIYILLPKMTLFRVKNLTLQLPNLGQLLLFSIYNLKKSVLYVGYKDSIWHHYNRELVMRPFKLSNSRNPKPDSQFSVEIRNDSLTIGLFFYTPTQQNFYIMLPLVKKNPQD